MSKLIPVFDDDLKARLQIADSVTGLDSDMALKCRLALYIVQWTFQNTPSKEDVFVTNPLNTFTAMVIKKSMEKSVIDLHSETSELIKDLKLDWKDVIGFVELRNHRHFQSHSYTGQFTDKQVREFVEQDLHHKDDMASKVWFVRSSIIELMIKNKLKTCLTLRVEGTAETASLVFQILKCSMKDIGTINVGTINTMMGLFSAALMAVYTKEWQERFQERYSECRIS